MPSDDVVLRLEDGRRLAVSCSGDESGATVIWHGGSPGSRHLSPHQLEDASLIGVRLVSIERPGYGGSTPLPGRDMASSAADVAAVCRQLEIERCGVVGISGGGDHALACAALLPGLVVGAVVIATFAPWGADGLQFTEGLHESTVREVDDFFKDEEAARERFRRDAEQVAADLSDPASWMARWGDAAGRDRAHDEVTAAWLAATIREATAGGDQGWWDDWRAVLTPWGFDPADIAVPGALWHGARDDAVPVGHGRWLASRIPHCTGSFPADDDHASIEDAHRLEALGWLHRLVAG